MSTTIPIGPAIGLRAALCPTIPSESEYASNNL